MLPVILFVIFIIAPIVGLIVTEPMEYSTLTYTDALGRGCLAIALVAFIVAGFNFVFL